MNYSSDTLNENVIMVLASALYFKGKSFFIEKTTNIKYRISKI